MDSKVATAFQTAEAARAAGQAARQVRPRRQQGIWEPAPHRTDPVAILAAQGKSRIQELLPERYRRMRASPFTFLRGAAAIMAADLGSQPHSGLYVQLGGDAHVQNFGSYASPEGLPVFDANDFDETLPGPFEWDVKRLAASLAVCGRVNGLNDSLCHALAARAVRHYRRHMGRIADMTPLDAWNTRIDLAREIESIDDHKLRRRAQKRLAAALEAHDDGFGLIDARDPTKIRDHGTTQHIEAYTPTIEAAFAAYPATQPVYVQALLSRYRLADTAFKVVGVGSVGTFCAIGLFLSADGAPLLLQVKEAQASVLAPFAGKSVFANHGERVVVGQRTMQAQTDVFLGFSTKQIGKRSFYVRRVKDAKLADIGATLEVDALPFAASLCGRTLARAHGRGGDAAILAGYMGDGDAFESAIADFAMAYADQTDRDWAAFCRELDTGGLAAG
jgi:uncharacterized protein (DUF2252 family)